MLRVKICLVVMVLIQLAAKSGLSQKIHVLLNDERVLATRIDLSAGGDYVLSKDQVGSVWTALNPVVLTTTKDAQRGKKQVHAGVTATLDTGEQVEFRAGSSLPTRLIVVKPKRLKQDLTVTPFVLNGSLEDASDRNATLLVALSSCRFQDIRNLGNESEWIPSKADIVVMRAGSVKWIGPGIHHYKNLGPSAARMIAIEW